MADLTITRLTATLYRYPLEREVITSFGRMRDRPMLIVEVEDRDGAKGWGEVWCNFPHIGGEHRVRILREILAPMVVGHAIASPAALFDSLTAQTAVLAIQSAEPGPFAQAIAGIDLAVTDLAARRAGQPLWRYLGGTTPSVPVYASGLNPDECVDVALSQRAAGHRRYKLKIGFGLERDLGNAARLRAALGDDTEIMVDVNQGWSLDRALVEAPQFDRFVFAWLEEPVRATTSWANWRRIAAVTRTPLAAGENLLGNDQFDAALSAGILSVIQPDAAKWGGFSGTLPVARAIVAAGRRFCPHYLGGGIGLLASAHLLAAAGGSGLLEIDSNPNPLRTLLCGPVADVAGGAITLSQAPGLGIVPDLAPLARYAVA
jgi:L-alanine-DL-glutamate epimerase-like enolase superfamily enzyme